MNEGLDKEPEITNEYIAQIQKDGDKVTLKKWVPSKYIPWVFGSKPRWFSPGPSRMYS